MKTLVRVLITFAVLGSLFWQVKWRAVWDILGSLQAGTLGLVLLLCLPVHLLQFARWSHIAKQSGAAIMPGDLKRGYWVGFTLGLVTPGRLGQYGRALALHGCSMAEAFGISFLDRAYAGFTINGVGLIALSSLPLLGWNSMVPGLNGGVATVGAALGCAIVLLGFRPSVLVRPFRWIANWLPRREQLFKGINVFGSVSPLSGVLLMILAVGALSAALLQFVLLLHGMGAPVPWMGGMLAVLLTFFLKGLLPFTIGSLGIAEWSAVVILRGFGVEPAQAVGASLLLFTVNVLLPSLVGIPYLSSLRVPDFRRRDARTE
ncbi:flippase-like domain-containing protein [candidate division KSB1 bacterium]|nr:flippase-like domain-containing protein [candidate division KSB1 bacterium]